MFEKVVGEGIIINDEIKRIFEVGIRDFISSKKNPLQPII